MSKTKYYVLRKHFILAIFSFFCLIMLLIIQYINKDPSKKQDFLNNKGFKNEKIEHKRQFI